MPLDREAVLKVLRLGPTEGLKTHELADRLGADQKTRHRLRRILGELMDEDAIEKAPGMRYRLKGVEIPPQPGREGVLPRGQVVGELRVHPAGYGFVVREDGEDDVYVAARHRGTALDGDRVAISTWLGYKGTEGRVESILERGRARLTGTLHGRGRSLSLDADDPRLGTAGLVLIEGGSGGARDGEAVLCEITRYPSRAEEPIIAKVVSVLGDPDDPRTEVLKVLVSSDISEEFPDEVKELGERAPKEVGTEDRADRVDLRDRLFLTIDPETARDFDDAVCVEKSPRSGHTRLWVAVADVSHYVRPGSALDREARARGCSIYLPDRAIPMLPHELSSEICSLKPEVDRLAMVVRVEVAPDGSLHDPYFCAAVIRSRARLDYPGVAGALAGDLRGSRARYAEYLPVLEEMAELSARLRKVRTARGALDFDLPEAKVILDEDDPRRVRDVTQSRADPDVKRAYQLIEDFMLAANEAVATHFREREIDAIWRVHDVPSDERLSQFAAIAESFGVRFDPEEGKSPKRLRDFLAAVRGRPMEASLNFLLLRALRQAVYDVVNLGHFGLAARDYVHFTSPIRRYPDLIVHRLLKSLLHVDGLAAGGPPPTVPSRETLQAMASESSAQERCAMEAEREVVDMYRAFLMRDRVGEEYDGKVAGVAAFGLFVQIDAPFVEGLVRVATLGDDHYVFDEETMRLTGSRSGRGFKLGDAVRVRIENVSVPRRKIDLALVEHTAVPIIELGGERQERARKRAEAHGKRKSHLDRRGVAKQAAKRGGRDHKPKGRDGGRRR